MGVSKPLLSKAVDHEERLCPCRRRQNAEYRALGPGGGGFNAAAFDEASFPAVECMDLICFQEACAEGAHEGELMSKKRGGLCETKQLLC